MLSSPRYGWSDFRLEGISAYSLSYLVDIPIEWLDQAIHGLETMHPFCVKGFLEPDRFLCIVSYWNCHIVCEDHDREASRKETIIHETSHTSMLAFCRLLSADIGQALDAWCSFTPDHELDEEKRKATIAQKLNQLNRLIAKRESLFESDWCFL